jgi:hypothetical protein
MKPIISILFFIMGANRGADAVSTAIHGGAAAVNAAISRRLTQSEAAG